MRIAVPSHFPWSPGHVVLETEKLIQTQVLSKEAYPTLIPWLRGPVTDQFFSYFGDQLKRYNIFPCCDYQYLTRYFAEASKDDIKSISLSHSVHLDTANVTTVNGRLDGLETAFVLMSNKRLAHSVASNKEVMSAANSFARDYYSLPKTWSPLRTNSNSKALDEFLNQANDTTKIVILNIREHTANASIGLDMKDFIPLISYLKHAGYTVVDAGHSQKNYGATIKPGYILNYWEWPGKSFHNDIELFAKASFYVGGGGISHLAYMLRVPSIWVGNIMPFIVPSWNGYQIPCSMYDRQSYRKLTAEEAFSTLITLREPWEPGYDCWSKSWKTGSSNPFNCMEELKERYVIHKPPSVSMLKTFMLLEDEVNEKKYSSPFEMHNVLDINESAFTTMPLSPYA